MHTVRKYLSLNYQLSSTYFNKKKLCFNDICIFQDKINVYSNITNREWFNFSTNHLANKTTYLCYLFIYAIFAICLPVILGKVLISAVCK